MSIRAVIRNGQIQPVEPLPPEWAEGQEVTIEVNEATPTEAELDEWYNDLQRGIAEVSQEDHERFRKAMEEIEAESKRLVRREWGME